MKNPCLLPLAHVQSPRGLWYIAHALNHHGFVVQRRYVGVGTPSYFRLQPTPAAAGMLWETHAFYRPHLVPFLNPESVRLAGLDMAYILAWCTENPGAVFAHPTYGPLCLRWGENPHGFSVVELSPKISPIEIGPLCFTPHTCWLSGTTFYQLATYLEDDDPLFIALYGRAGLVPHLHQIGAEGTWTGWYTTDRGAIERVLASYGRTFVLDQVQLAYCVWEVHDNQREHRCMYYATVEEAVADYHSVLEDSTPRQYPIQSYPQLGIGFNRWLQGQETEQALLQEKQVFAHDLGLLRQRGFLNSREGTILSAPTASAFLAADDQPIQPAVPTLTDRLNTIGASREWIATQLGISLLDLRTREQDPALLTISEVQKLARLIGAPLPEFFTFLQQEIASGTPLHKQFSRQVPLAT
jgi:hypothetical protein